jgi:23S rRNA (cytidine1920-2'-O)/16S rRNA (cytidine1409-2'-O)-methyltransferase
VIKTPSDISDEQYVSRAAYKLESVASSLGLNFKDKVVLDVGSSTGGFTDFALRHGAKKIIAVDSGTNQLHPSLRGDSRIELHEQTDIREFNKPKEQIDIVLIDVSFVSLRQILPSIVQLIDTKTQVISMFKPQFEASSQNQKNRGVVKNERIRRQIIKDFELWVQKLFKIVGKSDSHLPGSKGNLERFYTLKLM